MSMNSENEELSALLPHIEYNPIVFNSIMPYKEKRAMYSDEISDYLKKKFGIDATISEYNANKYSFNGKNLTHEQVIDIIKGE